MLILSKVCFLFFITKLNVDLIIHFRLHAWEIWIFTLFSPAFLAYWMMFHGWIINIHKPPHKMYINEDWIDAMQWWIYCLIFLLFTLCWSFLIFWDIEEYNKYFPEVIHLWRATFRVDEVWNYVTLKKKIMT